MAEKCWTIGSVNDEVLNELMSGLYGYEYKQYRVPGGGTDIINIAKELLALTPVKYREVLAACYRLLDVKKKELRTLPNNPETFKVTVEVNRKKPIDPFGLITRTVTEKQQVYDPAFQSIRDLLDGEKYILIRSERSEEEKADFWEENDYATVLTESGRLLLIGYTFKYLLPVYTRADCARELDHTDRKTNLLLAAEIYLNNGVQEFMKLLTSDTSEYSTRYKNTGKKKESNASEETPNQGQSSKSVINLPETKFLSYIGFTIAVVLVGLMVVSLFVKGLSLSYPMICGIMVFAVFMIVYNFQPGIVECIQLFGASVVVLWLTIGFTFPNANGEWAATRCTYAMGMVLVSIIIGVIAGSKRR